jgi:hypothetical protein
VNVGGRLVRVGSAPAVEAAAIRRAGDGSGADATLPAMANALHPEPLPSSL